MQRIRDDSQVQKLLTGFVLLQMNVDNKAHLEWRNLVPFEGNTLPIVYAVRADRHPIFAKSTMLPDSEFPMRLVEWLSESGAALQPRDIELLDAATQSAQKALESGDVNELVRQTRKARKFLIDHAPCYARAALEFEGVFNPLVEDGKKAMESILELTEGTTSMETIAARALTYAQSEYTLEQLGLLENEFKATEKKINGVREVRASLADARKVVTVGQSKQLSEAQRKSLQEIAIRQSGNVIGNKATELVGTRD